MKTQGIQPTGAPVRPVPARHAAAASQPWGVDTVETGTPQEPPPGLGMGEAARLLMGREGLKKGEVPYRVRDWTAGSDGSMYLLYSEERPGKRGYLARVSPEGRLAWELPLEQEDMRHLGALPDGGVRVGASSGAVAVNAEGRVVRVEESPQEVWLQWTDSSGVRYEILQDKQLRAVDPQGREVTLPEQLQQVQVNSGRRLPDGGMLLRSDGQAFALAPGGALKGAWKLPEWPRQGHTSHVANEVLPLADGGLMIQKQSMTVMPRQFDDLPPGGFGGRFGGGFGGHWDPAPTSYSDTSLVRLDAAGKELWTSHTLGSSPKVVVAPNGEAWAEGYSGGKSEVPFSHVRAEDGTVEMAFEVEGSVHELRAEPGGTLLVGHSGIWTRMTPDGKVVAEASSHPDHSGAALMGVQDDGRLIFRDRESSSAWACRLETGQWTALTDATGDHSIVLARREEAEAGPPPEVREDEEEWVVIGDVRLPRRTP